MKASITGKSRKSEKRMKAKVGDYHLQKLVITTLILIVSAKAYLHMLSFTPPETAITLKINDTSHPPSSFP